jgi:hypothetical protein
MKAFEKTSLTQKESEYLKFYFYKLEERIVTLETTMVKKLELQNMLSITKF